MTPHTTSAAKRISHIAQMWFLSEPLYFSVYCSHELTANSIMPIPMRVGEGRLEYNPEIIATLPEHLVEERMKVELLRVLLQHPYQRQPHNADLRLLGLASNMAIHTNLMEDIDEELVPEWLSDKLPDGLSFEEYYYLLADMAEEDPDLLDSFDEYGFVAELWQEDGLLQQTINDLVQAAAAGNSFGNIPDNLVEVIKAATVPKLDLSAVLRGFKTSILSLQRTLTRMRPSRRYGFEQMGCRRPYTTSLLVAVDVSGSVTSKMLSTILGHINRLFKQGIEAIDILQFDCELKLPVMPIAKSQNQLTITGRGGTDFQPVADFYADSKYDGLIICTDGEAPDPMPKGPTPPVIWLEFGEGKSPMMPSIKYGWERRDITVP